MWKIITSNNLPYKFFPSEGRAPKITLPPPPPQNKNDEKNADFMDEFIHSVKTSLQTDKTTFTPEIKNTTVTPSVTKGIHHETEVFRTPLAYIKCAFCIEIFSKLNKLQQMDQYFISNIYQLINAHMVKDKQLHTACRNKTNLPSYIYNINVYTMYIL